MKRTLLLSVSAAAMFINAPAFGQNTSTVNQGATLNTANVTQSRSVGADKSTIEQNVSAGAGSNSATVNQSGPNASNSSTSESTIKQTGTSDTASVTQEAYTPLSGGEKNTSTINQAGTGVGSSATVEQYGHNASTIGQANASNNATVRQGNTSNPAPAQPVGGNTSDVSQDGDDTANVDQNYQIPATGVGNYGGNSSIVSQGAGANSATVNQTGLLGTSSITQSNGSTANVTQNGDDQFSDVMQTSTGTATVTQSGDNNDSFVTQDSDADAFVTQNGNDNLSRVTQEFNQSNVSANVNQNGNSNDSNVLQGFGRNNMSATVNQNGDDNESVVVQAANGTTATVNQTRSQEQFPLINGRSNSQRIDQFGASSTASVTQTGEINESGLRQEVGATNSDATHDQTGIYNLAITNQSADNVSATVTQSGVPAAGGFLTAHGDNDSRINQSGANSIATVDQTANVPTNGRPSNFSTIVQSGAESGASVTQSGDGNTSDVGQLGINNDATITQIGLNNDSGVSQTGNDNVATVGQNGNGGISDVSQQSNNNDATVSQASAATSTITQRGSQPNPGPFNGRRNNVANTTQGSNATGSTATVDQNGVLNKSDITQNAANTVADVKQNNIYNTSTVDQTGEGAKAFVTQGGGYGDNVSTVKQTATATANVTQTGQPSVGPDFTNISNIDQSGASSATITQNGSHNLSDAFQSGDGNSAKVNQDGTFQTSFVDQSGDNGVVDIGQDEGSSNNSATVRQGGLNNDSFVYQFGAGTSGNSADVTQNGTGNANRTLQYSGYNRLEPATGNTVIVNQTATSSNSLTTTAQEGSGNLADIKVEGAGVSVLGRQTSSSAYYNEPPETDVWQISDNNKAYIEQASDASRVTIYQGLEQPVQAQFGYNLALGTNNYAKVVQTAGADGSRGDVIQGGSDNIANVTQSGLNSISYLNQLGTGNEAGVTQTGDNNQSYLTQNGNGHDATVNQSSNGNVSNLLQNGNGNSAIVQQGPM